MRARISDYGYLHSGSCKCSTRFGRPVSLSATKLIYSLLQAQFPDLYSVWYLNYKRDTSRLPATTTAFQYVSRCFGSPYLIVPSHIPHLARHWVLESALNSEFNQLKTSQNILKHLKTSRNISKHLKTMIFSWLFKTTCCSSVFGMRLKHQEDDEGQVHRIKDVLGRGPHLRPSGICKNDGEYRGTIEFIMGYYNGI